MRFSIGPYLGSGAVDDPFVPPEGVVASIKLARQPSRLALFVTPDDVALGRDWREIAQGDVDAIPSAGLRSVFASAIGLQTVTGDTIADWVRDAMTFRAVPDGEGGIAPLVPTRRLQCELHMGRAVRWPFKVAENPVLVEQLRRQYRRHRAAARDGKLRDDVHHLRVLDAWKEKYRTQDDRLFVPADLPIEARVPHETTLGDTFADTDLTDLASHTATGANGGHSWTYLHNTGIWEINGNQLRQDGSFGSARAESDLSSDDHYSQVEVAVVPPTNSEGVGVMGRKDSTATLSYYLVIARNSQWQTWEWTAGSLGQIGTTSSVSTVLGDVIRIECDGSTIRRVRNGGTQQETTDTTTSGGMRCGLSSIHNATDGETDNWECADLGAAASAFPALYYHAQA